jgi:hypothetical protein
MSEGWAGGASEAEAREFAAAFRSLLAWVQAVSPRYARGGVSLRACRNTE